MPLIKLLAWTFCGPLKFYFLRVYRFLTFVTYAFFPSKFSLQKSCCEMYSDYQNVHVVFNSLIRRKPLSAIFRCNSSYCAPSPLPPGLPDGSNTLSSSPSLCVCAAPVQGLAGPARLILLSFPVPAWRRDLPDRHGLYLMPCVLLQEGK